MNILFTAQTCVKINTGPTLWFLSMTMIYCQAQPQLQLHPWLKAEIALFSNSPPTHPDRKVVLRSDTVTYYRLYLSYI